MNPQDLSAPSSARARLIVEFVAFFLVAPVMVALVLPPQQMFPALFAVTAIGLVLLHLTPGFHWSDLTNGMAQVSWRFVLGTTLATLVVGYLVMRLTAPEALWLLVRANPGLLVMIALLYPVLSALPQEIVFRPLFFRRYAALLPQSVPAQVVLNAAVFSLAHLMYWSWIVAAMTFSGGLAFAYAYRVRRNFPEAVLLHSLAGIVVFALGLGVYFYSGNVQKPF